MADVLTKEQFMSCAAYLSAGVGRKMEAEQLRVYYDALNDIPVDVLMMCCKRAIQEQKENWLPSVGLIRSFASEAMNGQLPAWADEWDHVRKLVRTLGYIRKADAMRAMSPLSQQAVRAVGWDTICDSENISIQAAQFRMAYEAAAKREQDMRRISPELRPVIADGPRATPRIHRGEISESVRNLADRMTPPDEGAA